MNTQLTIPLSRPKIVRLIGVIQIFFAVTFIAITIYSTLQKLPKYQSIIPNLVFPISVGLLFIIVVIAFIRGYQWGRIVLAVFMVTAMIDGVFGILTNNAPVISGLKLTIQGITFIIITTNKEIQSYFKTSKQIRMGNR